MAKSIVRDVNSVCGISSMQFDACQKRITSMEQGMIDDRKHYRRAFHKIYRILTAIQEQLQALQSLHELTSPLVKGTGGISPLDTRIKLIEEHISYNTGRIDKILDESKENLANVLKEAKEHRKDTFSRVISSVAIAVALLSSVMNAVVHYIK